ncbi:hypothetical protein VTO73DRAFT_6310 [Trametes versicolor]
MSEDDSFSILRVADATCRNYARRPSDGSPAPGAC